MEIEFRDNPEDQRFEVFADGDLAGFAQYRLHEGRITMFDTEVEPRFEGHGLGSELARRSLDNVKGRGLELVPTCPFIAGYVRRHPDEYLQIVMPSLRERVMSED